MKKLLSITMLLISSLFVYAQQDVTKFLGIPVDGSKSEMIQKLKAKGYTSSQHNKEILVGEFNGTDVNIHIATNNNKVCRIMVCGANSIDEGGIRIRFNRLCEQFKKNSKYLSLQDYTISEDEDISYEMSVHSKKYDALFYQAPLVVDSVETANKLRAALLVKYTEEQLTNPTEEIKKDIYETSTSFVLDMMLKKPVWFRIEEFAGKYYIAMYYDNEYNRANGEDL